MNKEKLISHYKEVKPKIEVRLKQFEELETASDERLFLELCFVILSSQSSAEEAWKASKALRASKELLNGDKNEIAEVLDRFDIQYERDKAGYIVENRSFLSQPTLTNPEKGLKIREKLDFDDLDKTRLWIAENVRGIGLKGASHFLRNIGHGNSFCIVSKHICQQMYMNGIIESAELPKSDKEYFKVESKFQDFAKDLGIPVLHLDFVLWSLETDKVFK